MKGLLAQHSSLSSSAVSWLPAAIYLRALAGCKSTTHSAVQHAEGLAEPHQTCLCGAEQNPIT